LVVPAGDATAAARALERLLSDPQEADAMGRRGREAALALYSWEREAEALLGHYAKLGLAL
jgi:glycosyltransferase involved in cell wall biosynthesis